LMIISTQFNWIHLIPANVANPRTQHKHTLYRYMLLRCYCCRTSRWCIVSST
jgi:hypothetical protein